VVLVAAIIVAIVVVATGGDSGKPAKQPGEAVAGQTAVADQLRGIPQKGIALGDPKAPVTMVEFGDLQCPVCKDYSDTVLPTLVDKYVRTGKVRLELRTIPIIDEDSNKANAMANAAGLQDKLWNYAELFYVNQGPERTGYITDDFVKRIGRGVPGLDVGRAFTQSTTQQVRQKLADAVRLAQIHGVNSTPSFLIGPTGGDLKPLQFTRLDPGQFGSAIDQVLKQA
jgi:protein-disulfide isomerase